MKYLRHLSQHTKPTQDVQVLLILDGHKSHTKNIELINFARDNGIEIFSLTPHTLHKLQPLDRTFFKPFKVAFNTDCTSWMRLHQARGITLDTIAGLLNTAYIKAATIKHATSGFRCISIVPYNSKILPETVFLSIPRDPLLSNSDSNTAEVISTPSTRSVTTGNHDTLVDMTNHASSVVTTDDKKPVAFSSQMQVNFDDIVKVPEIVEKKKTKRSVESVIITDTPYKRAQQNPSKDKSVKVVQ